MNEIKEKIFGYLIATPKMLFLAVLSFLSGHFWVYIYFAYIKNGSRSAKRIDNLYGKVVLGLIWFAIILTILYGIMHKTILNIQYELIMDLILSTILIGLFLQAILFILILKLSK